MMICARNPPRARPLSAAIQDNPLNHRFIHFHSRAGLHRRLRCDSPRGPNLQSARLRRQRRRNHQGHGRDSERNRRLRGQGRRHGPPRLRAHISARPSCSRATSPSNSIRAQRCSARPITPTIPKRPSFACPARNRWSAPLTPRTWPSPAKAPSTARAKAGGMMRGRPDAGVMGNPIPARASSSSTTASTCASKASPSRTRLLAARSLLLRRRGHPQRPRSGAVSIAKHRRRRSLLLVEYPHRSSCMPTQATTTSPSSPAPSTRPAATIPAATSPSPTAPSCMATASPSAANSPAARTTLSPSAFTSTAPTTAFA